MWLLWQLIGALGTLLYRLWYRSAPSNYPYDHGDLRYATWESQGRHKHITFKRFVETPLRSKFSCTFSRETWFDRLCKWLGFGEEAQTGDHQFDDVIFVVSDHPGFNQSLLSTPELRRKILELIPSCAKSIEVTKDRIRIQLSGDTLAEEILDDVKELSDILSGLQERIPVGTTDSFYGKAVLAELVAWTSLGVAVGLCLDFMYGHGQSLLEWKRLATVSVATTLGLAAFFCVLLLLFLGRSSRTPRILADCGFLFLLSAPVWTASTIAHFNCVLDGGPGIKVTRQVAELRHNKSNRMGRKRHESFVLDLADGPDVPDLPLEMPRRIELDRQTYRTLNGAKFVEIEIGKGAFGLPWYRRIAVTASPL